MADLMPDTVEFYEEGKYRPFLSVKSAFQPNDGDLINIKSKTYEVLGRSFAVDYVGEPHKAMRCNVIVKERPNG